MSTMPPRRTGARRPRATRCARRNCGRRSIDWSTTATTVSAALAEAAAILASARETETTTGAARATAEATRETERQALLDAERRLSGDSGRLAELEAAQQAAAIEASRLEEGLASLAREQELALEGLPEETESSRGRGNDRRRGAAHRGRPDR